MKNPLKKPKIQFLFKFLFTVLLFTLFFIFFDFNKIILNMKRIDLIDIALICGLWFVSIIVSNYRWYMLISPIYKKIGFIYLLKTYLIGFFFNTFLPSSIGGDVYRIIKLDKVIKSKSQSAALVFIERLIGFLAIAFMAAGSLIYMGSGRLYEHFKYLAFGSFIALIVLMLFLLNEKIILFTSKALNKISFFQLGRRINDFYEKIHQFRDYKKILIYSFLISIIYQLLAIYVYYYTAMEMNMGISYFHLIIFVCLINIIVLIPFSIGGLGIREGGFALFFSYISLKPEDGLSLSLIVAFLTSLVHLLGGFVYLFEKKKIS